MQNFNSATKSYFSSTSANQTSGRNTYSSLLFIIISSSQPFLIVFLQIYINFFFFPPFTSCGLKFYHVGYIIMLLKVWVNIFKSQCWKVHFCICKCVQYEVLHLQKHVQETGSCYDVNGIRRRI